MKLSFNKSVDLPKIISLYEHPLYSMMYKKWSGIFIESENDYDRFILIRNEFYNKEGKYNKYIKKIPRWLLNILYRNIANDDDSYIILLDLYNFKHDWNDLSDYRFFIKNERNFNHKLILVSNEKKFNKNKYIIFFYQLFVNYENDIIKNKQYLIYYILQFCKYFNLYK